MILIVTLAVVIGCLARLPHDSIWSRVLALASATAIIEIIGALVFRDLSEDSVLPLSTAALQLCVGLFVRERLKRKANVLLPQQHDPSQRSPNDVS
jgi:hypothetical protein